MKGPLKMWFFHLIIPFTIWNFSSRVSAKIATYPKREIIPAELYYKQRNHQWLNLGDCIVTRDDKGALQSCNGVKPAGGDKLFVPKSKHISRVSRMDKTREEQDVVEGGVGVGISLGGFFSASISGKVRREVKVKARSISMMATLESNYGTDSLTNLTPPDDMDLSSARKKYFVSDIEYGRKDILKATMNFHSRSKRTEVEVTVKIKVLFLSFSKTIRSVSTKKSESFSMEVLRIKGDTVTNQRFSSRDMEKGLKYLEKLEEEFKTLPQNVKDDFANEKTRRNMKTKYYILPYNVLQVTKPPSGVVIPKTAVSLYFQSRLLRIYDELLDIDDSLVQLKDILGGSTCSRKSELIKLTDNTNTTLKERKGNVAQVLEDFYMLENEKIEELSRRIISGFGRRETTRSYLTKLIKLCPDAFDIMD